jgi:hypothetical protein
MAVDAALVPVDRLFKALCCVLLAFTRASIMELTSMPEPRPAIVIVPAIGFFLVQ